MQKIKMYFQSFDSFIQFIYGFRRRINEYYYRLFKSAIQKVLEKYVKKGIDNRLLLSRINNELLSLRFDLQLSKKETDYIRLEADRSMQGIYNLLGSGDVLLLPIDWHTDFKTGFRWPPGTFYKKYKQEEIDSDSDVKVPRELSRCHHFLKLGLAYKLTKNEKYAELCIKQITDWINENPLMYSINWGCTMDVAIRAVNWIWTLGLISDSIKLNNRTIDRIKASLYEHGWFIYRNPEKGLFNSSNHYLSDLAGQIHLGLLFKNMEEPKKWLKAGKEELFREIRMQILPSGMSYERSTNYNRLVLELILVPILILKQDGYEIPTDIWYRLEKMFEFIMYSLNPDGTSPIIGDQDNGRLLPFGVEETNNFRYLLSLGSLLFNRSDFKQYGEGFNIYCSILGGEGAMERWGKIPHCDLTLESIAFPDIGLYIMRKEDNYLLFNATGKGAYPELGTGTHTHSDLLSFVLSIKGKTFLIDPGSYVYTADASARMLFRSTQMHNTVAIDGESQNVLKKEALWDFGRNAIPVVSLWKSNCKDDKIIASHSGYERLVQPVTHTRTIIFNKEDLLWIIEDRFTGEGKHLFEWFYHFDIGIDFDIGNYTVKTICEDSKNIELSFKCNDSILIEKKSSLISKGYGSKQHGLVVVVSAKSDCPTMLITEIKQA
jgi:hypothetical protein